MKLKIIASPNSLSAIFSKKLFYQTFLKMNLVLMMMKLLYETKAKKKNSSLVKLSRVVLNQP